MESSTADKNCPPNRPVTPTEEPPVKKPKRDPDEVENFDYSQISSKDIEDYSSQLPFPLKGLLRVKTPTKLISGQWRAYCACGKCGADKDGETFCGSEISELDQYEIIEKFWEFFKKEDLHGFIKWAGEKTGRDLFIPKIHKHRVNVNYLSILMFYTLPKCCVALKWLDFMDSFKNCQQYAREKKKVLAYPETIYLPVCLADDHIVFEIGSVEYRKNCSRLIRLSNQPMLSKFIMFLESEQNKDQLIFNRKLGAHLKFLHTIAAKVDLYKKTLSVVGERNYVTKFHYCKMIEGGKQTKELCCVTMCDPCKNNNEIVIPLKDYFDNFFLQPV